MLFSFLESTSLCQNPLALPWQPPSHKQRRWQWVSLLLAAQPGRALLPGHSSGAKLALGETTATPATPMLVSEVGGELPPFQGDIPGRPCGVAVVGDPLVKTAPKSQDVCVPQCSVSRPGSSHGYICWVWRFFEIFLCKLKINQVLVQSLN